MRLKFKARWTNLYPLYSLQASSDLSENRLLRAVWTCNGGSECELPFMHLHAFQHISVLNNLTAVRTRQILEFYRKIFNDRCAYAATSGR